MPTLIMSLDQLHGQRGRTLRSTAAGNGFVQLFVQRSLEALRCCGVSECTRINTLQVHAQPKVSARVRTPVRTMVWSACERHAVPACTHV